MRLKNNLRRDYINSIFVVCLIMNVVTMACNPGNRQKNKVIVSLETYRQMRQEKLNQPRPVIHNNDGCDAYVFPLKVNPEFVNCSQPGKTWRGGETGYEFSIPNFLNLRSGGLKGADVSTISYCSISSAFGQFTHNTKIGEFITMPHQRPNARNVIPEFVKLGTDPLEVTCKFARNNGFEFFWSNRINDIHDHKHRMDKPFERWSEFKTKHPEYLFGYIGEELPHGRWSAIDFSYPEVRKLCVQYYTEVCENYDVDGIELDFFRHLHLFRNVARGEIASKEQLEMITDMVAGIREMTERVGMKKGKPILLLVRIPDSVGYCRGVGIDIETWMAKGLVDIIVGGGYLRLSPWNYLVELGQKYGVKVYAGLEGPRVKKEHPLLTRKQNPDYRARCAAAWQAGVDGLYIFNEYNTRSQYLREIGNANKIKNKNNLYFITPYHVYGANPNTYLKDGERFLNLPILIPEKPVILDSEQKLFSLELGDESIPAKVALIFYSKDGNPGAVFAKLNNVGLKFRKTTDEGISVFEIPQKSVKAGINNLTLSIEKSEEPLTLSDAAVLFYRNSDDPDTKELATICFDD